MPNKIIRSGDSTLDRNDIYFRKTFDEIIDKQFFHCFFHSYPALVSKDLIKGHRMWRPYYGGNFDKNKYDLVEDMWDHEHCSICNCKIIDGQSYWANDQRVSILCGECHEYFIIALT